MLSLICILLHVGGTILHWRGEGGVNYSRDLREGELINAMAVEGLPDLCRAGEKRWNRDLGLEDLVNSDMLQATAKHIPPKAVSRCALVRSSFRILGIGDGTAKSAESAEEMIHDIHFCERSSWCVRVRDYRDPSKTLGKSGFKSPLSRGLERDVCEEIAAFTGHFPQRVNLKNPDLQFYVFLLPGGTVAVTEKTGDGNPRLSEFAPNTRKCVTTTPLEPIAAFVMANLAQVSTTSNRVLDLYAGSCSTLLAAGSLINGATKLVGIERDNEWMVDFDKIIDDFKFRGLQTPHLIRGDCRNDRVLKEAINAMGGAADAVVADPPYGFRETLDSNESTPLRDIVTLIGRQAKLGGTPLLRPGGRLVVFVPIMNHEKLNLTKLGVSEKLLSEAGLVFSSSHAQRLNANLTRYLTAFDVKEEDQI